MKKIVFLFFSLFLIILVLGCTQPDKDEKENTTYIPSVIAGNLSVNKPITGKQLNMHGGEQVEIGFTFENKGEYTAQQVVSTLYGCNVDIKPNVTRPDPGEQKDIYAGTSDYVNWQIITPQIPPGTTTKCDLTARVCFDYATVASTEIDFIPQDYSAGPLEHVTTVSPGPFEVEFDFATPVRIWNETVPVSIGILYRNIGNGEVSYTGNAAKRGHLDKIIIEISDTMFKIKDARQWVRVLFPDGTASSSSFQSTAQEFFPGKDVTFSSGDCTYTCSNNQNNPPQGKCEKASSSVSQDCESSHNKVICDSLAPSCVWVTSENVCSQRSYSSCESDNYCILETGSCDDRIEINDHINTPNQLLFVEENDEERLAFVLDYDELEAVDISTKTNYFLPSPFNMKLGYDVKTRKYTTLDKRINLFVDSSTVDRLVSKGVTTKIYYRYCVTTDTLKLTMSD
jgi:hypothetical protein